MGINPNALEERTQQIGREIFAAVRADAPILFRSQWLNDWVMDWSMADEDVKVQMFRFIDVLPMLEDDEALAEHIQAYFADSQGNFPWLVRWATDFARPGTLRGRMIARAIRANAIRMARRFIAGFTPGEVLEAVKKLRAENMTFTMDLLGEATVTEREADDYQRQYLELLESLCPTVKQWSEVPILDRDHEGPIPRVNLSFKITALSSQCDPIDPEGSARAVAPRLRAIARAAKKLGAFLNVDMEQYAFKDLTLSIVRDWLEEEEFRDWSNVGIAIQCYLRETPHDLRELLEWAKRRGTPLWVRLVKGAYWDYETVLARQQHWPVPVFTQKWQSDACFEDCTRFLLENHRWLRPAFASHNVRGMAYALAVAEYLRVPHGAYELQMLYGMADPLKRAFVDRGERLRIYTPFGRPLPGMAYLVRRLLENTSNTSFLRASFTENVALDQLLAAPRDLGHRYPSEPEIPTMTAQTSATRAKEGALPPFTNEPLTNYSQAIARDRMRAALDRTRAQFGHRHDLWIGGESITTQNYLEARNPADRDQLLAYVARGSGEHADLAVEAAVAASPKWRATSVWRRAEVLFEAARRMRARREMMAAWQVHECGKQWREADADVAEAIDFCEYYARGMLELSAPRTRNVPGEDNSYFYHPRGVTVVIAPWNFPLAILCGMAMAPLVAGNTVILKPAEQASLVAAQFVALLRELDIPPGVVNFLPGLGEEVGRRLVAHPDVSVITFTGSLGVGREIHRSAAQTGRAHIKHVVAELGGKNAIIIDEDADLDEAVKGVVASAYGYQGQKCSACSRVIVLPRVHDAFVQRLREAIAALTIGAPENPTYSLGPVIDGEAFARLQQIITSAKSEATCLYAGDPGNLCEKGWYIGPHLFADSAPDSFLGQQEFFGPILTVFRAGDLTEALAIANGTPFALTGGIFSRNPVTLERVRAEFLVGNLYVNRKITGALVDLQPFGGFKLSGLGAKAGGPDYLRQFLVPRTVTENTLRRGFAPDDE